MRHFIIGILLIGCAEQPAMIFPDAYSMGDGSIVGDAGMNPDTGSDAGQELPDAAPGTDAWVMPTEDAGVDAAAPDSSSPAADAGVDAAATPPAHPSAVVEITEMRCFRDADHHAWCMRGASTTRPFPEQELHYVGNADHLRGECGIDHGDVVCLSAALHLEPMGFGAAELATWSTASLGCAMPGDGTTYCWDGAGHRWSFHQATGTTIDATMRPPHDVVLLQQASGVSGPSTQYMLLATLDPSRTGSIDLGASSGATFGFETVEHIVGNPSGTDVCWHSSSGAVYCRSNVGSADDPALLPMGTVTSSFIPGFACGTDTGGTVSCVAGGALSAISSSAVYAVTDGGACVTSSTGITCYRWSTGTFRVSQTASW